MSTTPKFPVMLPEEPEEIKAPRARTCEHAIRASVLSTLGRPVQLFRVNVMHLWDKNYRVNVVIGDDATAVSIPNSFFVTVDERGTILRSEPPIQKQY